MIWLDVSERSIVVCCRLCPSWRELETDRARALEAGARHADMHAAAQAAAHLRERHARIEARRQ